MASRMTVARAFVAGLAVTAAFVIGAQQASAVVSPPTPTVSPSPVALGGSVTVSGTDCVSPTPNGNAPIVAYVKIDGVGTTGTDVIGGAWSVTIPIPAATTLGSHQVLVTCDYYIRSFVYPATQIIVGAVTSPPSITPTTAPAPTAVAGSDSVVAGGTIAVDASNFGPGESVTGTLFSTAIGLGTFAADASGALHLSVAIPADLEPGTHKVQLVGLSSGLTASVSFTVTAAPTTITSSSALASTGSPVRGLTVFGFVLVLLGVSLVSLRRRRTGTDS
jgi:LPXTG-motif cell wall-anchored protein